MERAITIVLIALLGTLSAVMAVLVLWLVGSFILWSSSSHIINENEWVCTGTYQLYHPREHHAKTGWHDAYTTTECGQWNTYLSNGEVFNNQ